jgi:hypothetical protein
MSYTRLAAVAAVLFLSVSACSKSEDQAEAAVEASGNGLLAFVPADTPYLAANLQPTPDDVIDAFLLRAQPVLDTMQDELSAKKAEMEAAQAGNEQGAELALAIMQELDGKLNRPGLESLGFDLQMHTVFYGMGAFPVFRFELSDANALRETILRIQQNAGIHLPELEYQGVAYWRLGEEGQDASQVDHPGAYIAILQDHLAFTAFPASSEAELLPAFLGLEMPAHSNAETVLSGLNQQYGYSPYGTGFLDVQKLADEFLNPDSTLAQALASSGEFDPATITPECKAEFEQIIAHTPRMVVGVTELTPTAISSQYRLETEASLAQQLVQLVSAMPLAATHSDRMLELSFGMKFGPVRDFLREKTEAIVAQPFQCEHLLDLNASAQEALTKLNEPMPPFVNNFEGLRLSLNNISMGSDLPGNASGLTAIHVDKPEMFVGMAQMFLPNLAELQLSPGDPPVRLPDDLIPVPGIVTHAALSPNAIGLSVGDGEETGLVSYLNEPSVNDGTFLSVNYDTAAYMEFAGNMEDQWQDDTEGMENMENVGEQHHEISEIAESMQDAVQSMVDRSYATLRFTPEGFLVDSRMTFK